MHKEIIQDIRKRCRMAMNGVASASMREYGLHYKLNFGVPVQKIKEISSRYKPDEVLAEKLWQDGTRELKILATMLYPIESFTEDIARRWIREIPNQEIREQLGFNLFQFLPYASEIGRESALDASGEIRATGYWFLSRYLMKNNLKGDIDLDSMIYIWKDVASDDLFLRNAAKLFLKNVGKISKRIAYNILDKIAYFKDSESPIEKEVYHSLVFEFDFYYGNYKY